MAKFAFAALLIAVMASSVAHAGVLKKVGSKDTACLMAPSCPY